MDSKKRKRNNNVPRRDSAIKKPKKKNLNSWELNSDNNTNNNTNNNNVVRLDEEEVECTCATCECGRMRCWICGQGVVPMNYQPCRIHERCYMCGNTSVIEIHGYGPVRRAYIGPIAENGVCRACTGIN